MTQRTTDQMRSLIKDRSGVVTIILAIALPSLVALGSAGLDLARIARAKQQLQRAADGAVLAGAGALRFANTSSSKAASIAEAHARSSAYAYPDMTVQTAVKSSEVQIDVAADVSTSMLKYLNNGSTRVSARARAQLVGSMPTCMLVLDPSMSKAYEADQASVSASGCAIFANSTASDAVKIRNNAAIKASFICSSGGASADGATFDPAPQTDCPSRYDPLSSRELPSVGSCTSSSKLSLDTSTTIAPGVYCGGIEINKNAAIALQPGTYIIKDGPLRLNGNAALSGSGVTIFLTGSGAELSIDGEAAMSLTAPAYGTMAGLLIVGDRTLPAASGPAGPAGPGPAGKAQPLPKHRLHSRSAPTLLGTVYLPQGTLEIGAPGGYDATSAGMAQNSAWTIIVVRQLTIHDKINLVLNTNYAATDVPPPQSLVQGTAVRLAN